MERVSQSSVAAPYVFFKIYICTPGHVTLLLCSLDKPNPPDSVKSSCVQEYPEINAQNLQLSWTPPRWNDLLDGIDLYGTFSSIQVLLISRHNHPNEQYYGTVQPRLGLKKQQTLRLESEYCIALVTSARQGLEQYFISEGNSTLHHCSESCEQSKMECFNVFSFPFCAQNYVIKHIDGLNRFL